MSLNRRSFLKRALFAGAAAGFTDAIALEPGWFEITRPDIPPLGLGLKLVHLTDIHYRGNRDTLERIVELTNAERPDLVCFTGDLMDRKNREPLPEALEILGGIRAPMFGVPGNHDPRDAKSTEDCRKAFSRNGGAWLREERIEHRGLAIHGTYGTHGLKRVETLPAILLCHYPAVGDCVPQKRYDLVLSGHSHGGQCRIPFIRPLYLPRSVGRYIEGFFPEAPIGPLYVSRGLGSSILPLRFLCRPELAVIRI